MERNPRRDLLNQYSPGAGSQRTLATIEQSPGSIEYHKLGASGNSPSTQSHTSLSVSGTPQVHMNKAKLSVIENDLRSKPLPNMTPLQQKNLSLIQKRSGLLPALQPNSSKGFENRVAEGANNQAQAADSSSSGTNPYGLASVANKRPPAVPNGKASPSSTASVIN